MNITVWLNNVIFNGLKQIKQMEAYEYIRKVKGIPQTESITDLSYSLSIEDVIELMEGYKGVKNNVDLAVVSVRDFFAANALKAEIQSWNAEMSDEYRAMLLEDMIERHGETTVYEALAKNAFEMADAMLHAR